LKRLNSAHARNRSEFNGRENPTPKKKNELAFNGARRIRERCRMEDKLLVV
jgi:hypothetical protein